MSSRDNRSGSGRGHFTYDSLARNYELVLDYHVCPDQLSQLREIPTSNGSDNIKVCDLTRQEYMVFSRLTWSRNNPEPAPSTIKKVEDFQHSFDLQSDWGGEASWTGKVDEAFKIGRRANEALKEFRTEVQKTHRGSLMETVTNNRKDFAKVNGQYTMATWFDIDSDSYLKRLPRVSGAHEISKECERLNNDHGAQTRSTNRVWTDWVVDDICHSSEDSNYSSFGVGENTPHNWPLIKLVKSEGPTGTIAESG
ncbi:uncharacterized protein L199_000835 [Kwoniella botswanensis]|uniref:uncharacterized protein n=1 Tax=Kwoniella botswanensis TaxID=1268659 RepID=UPI00315D0407